MKENPVNEVSLYFVPHSFLVTFANFIVLVAHLTYFVLIQEVSMILFLKEFIFLTEMSCPLCEYVSNRQHYLK